MFVIFKKFNAHLFPTIISVTHIRTICEDCFQIIIMNSIGISMFGSRPYIQWSTCFYFSGVPYFDWF